jgi:YesN/AraC family two-component response regulator
MKAGPSSEFLNEFIPRLENYMETSGAYRRKGITVYDIAKDLGIAPNVLSNILNKHYNQRFNDYINGYRIDYVTKRLKSDSEWRKLSIEGLAEDAGFSSRSPFYAAFRKYTGLTPSLFVKEQEG